MIWRQKENIYISQNEDPITRNSKDSRDSHQTKSRTKPKGNTCDQLVNWKNSLLNYQSTSQPSPTLLQKLANLDFVIISNQEKNISLYHKKNTP